jgi:hypothetical protein
MAIGASRRCAGSAATPPGSNAGRAIWPPWCSACWRGVKAVHGRRSADIEPVRVTAETCGIPVNPGDTATYLIRHHAQVAACGRNRDEVERNEMRTGAMIDEQTFEGRQGNLTQANKISGTFATLLEALNRHPRVAGLDRRSDVTYRMPC